VGRLDKPIRSRAGLERRHVLVGHVQDQQLLVRRQPDPPRRIPARQLGHPGENVAADPAGHRRDTDPVPAVLLPVHPDVVAAVLGRRGGRRPVEEGSAEVVLLEHFPELLDTPVGDQELQPSPVAQPAVAVVTEDRDDTHPDVGDLLEADPGAEALGEHRVGREAAPHPDVEAGTELRVHHADERHVVRLVSDVEAGRAGDRRLELAGQVGELWRPDVAVTDLLESRRPVDDLGGLDPCDGRPEDDARRVPAGLGGHQANRLEALPDRRDVLDPDPVELDVLPVGDVGGVATELLADLGHGPELFAGEGTTVHADPEHEVLVVELAGLQRGGLPAVDPRAALGVEPPPAHPATQVVAGDGREAVAGVVVENPLPDVEPVVGLLELLVVVQRRAVAVRPGTGGLGGLPGWARRGSGHPSSLGPGGPELHNCPLSEPVSSVMDGGPESASAEPVP
jgi:hypothetical protein